MVGRAAPEIAPATTKPERDEIAKCRLTLAEGMKTIFDVKTLEGRFLGQVRTNFGGQFYRPGRDGEFLWVGNKWNPDIDPPHGLAIRDLLKETLAPSDSANKETSEEVPTASVASARRGISV